MFSQLVGAIAGAAGNLVASPPDPLCAQGSGFGVRHPPAWGSQKAPRRHHPQTTSLDVWRSAPKKNGSLSAPKSSSGKAMTAHHRCFGTAVPALVTRLAIVQSTGAAAPSDEGLRGPHAPASSAIRLVRALFHVQVWRKKCPLTCVYPYNFRLPRSIAGRALWTTCRYFHRTNLEIRKTPSDGTED